MAIFNRRNKTDVPDEIQEYYQTERRERAGIAWLLAFGTLVITIVLAAGIFFAGRWAYRKIAGTDNNNGTTQVTQNDDQQEDNQPADTPDQGGEEAQTDEERQAEEERERQAEEARKAEEERQAAEAREREQAEQQAQESADQDTAQQPSTGDNEQQVAGANESIPDTGPGDTAAIFFAVTVLGYLLHRLYFAKQD